MHLHYPEALLLLIPLAVLWVKYIRRGGTTGLFRVLTVLLLVFALTGPSLNKSGNGIDLWVLVDRSRSISPEARDTMNELTNRIRASQPSESRLGILEFGGNTRVKKRPGDRGGTRKTELDRDATDLHGALKDTYSLMHPGVPGRILVLSDGKYTTINPLPMAMWARSNNVPIDYRNLSRGPRTDVAVTKLSLPDQVEPGEPFQFSVKVQSDVEETVPYRVMRGKSVLAKGKRSVHPGQNRWIFRDRLEEPGIHPYRVEINREDDRVPENNLGLGAVRVNAPGRILVVQSGEQPRKDKFVRALQKQKLPVDVQTTNETFGSLRELMSYEAVVLENVSGGNLGRTRMSSIKNWVKNFGGGFLMTGGKRSFARGGYRESPLEPILPVSMDLKREHRKLNASVVIVLDRSGSMAANVRGGKTKMDLANIASIEAIKTLLPGDEVGVLAVNTAPDVVSPLRKIGDQPTKLLSTVKRIGSGGGGIDVRTGLKAATGMLSNSSGAVRHIILFSDARDSQQRNRVPSLVQKWNKAGITISVVGLGTNKDTHAEFLKEVAKKGGGQVYFTNDSRDLPRIFVQDISITVNRSFQEDPVSLQFLPDFRRISSRIPENPPQIGGYNITRLRKNASAGLVMNNKDQDPALAYWNIGLGRSAALPFEVDGKYTGPFLNWSHYGGFMSSVTRWLSGDASGENIHTDFRREGSTGIITVELDPERTSTVVGDSPTARIVYPNEAKTKTVDLTWRGPDTLEANVPLKEKGLYIGAVSLGNGRARELPPVGVPYSPEFKPRSSDQNWKQQGGKILKQIAEITGGTERINPEQAYETQGTARVRSSLIPLLALLGLLLMVLEIAWRRLRLNRILYGLWKTSEPARLLRYLKNALVPESVIKLFRKKEQTSPVTEASAPEKRQTGETRESEPPEEPEDDDTEQEDDDRTSPDVFDRAKRRAQDRLDEE